MYKMKNDHPHDGHRERLRNKIKSNGLESLEPHEVLEYILYFAIPRKNTNDIAHDLIKKFGSVVDVLEADKEKLVEVEGVGLKVADFLTSLPEISRYYFNFEKLSTIKFTKTKDIAKYLITHFKGKKHEIFTVICLNNKGELIVCKDLFVGTVNEVNVCMRKFTEEILATNCAAVLISHNHPNGFVAPSGNDLVLTKTIINLLQPLSIQFLDHILVAGKDFVSFRESGALRAIGNSDSSMGSLMQNTVEFNQNMKNFIRTVD